MCSPPKLQKENLLFYQKVQEKVQETRGFHTPANGAVGMDPLILQAGRH